MISPDVIETSWLIAVGISVDAAALTLCDFGANARLRRAIAWICAITLTHSVLPVAGIAGVGWAAQRFQGAQTVFYSLGAAVAVALIWGALHQTSASASGSSVRGSDEGLTDFLVKVAVVSADAALIGPGASATTRGWTTSDLTASLGLSMLFVGGILTLATAGAWMIGRRVQLQTEHSPRIWGIAHLGQRGVALPVYSYFVFAALTTAFERW